MIKKGIALLIMVLMVFVFVGCNESPTTITEPLTTTEQSVITDHTTTETPTTEVPTTVEDISMSQANVDAYKEESITIQFHYYLSQSASAYLETMIEDFETMYPNVDIVAVRRSATDAVIVDFTQGIQGGVAPELILTDQKYFSIYNHHFQSLDYYMNSEATLNGVNVGLPESVLEMNMFSDHSGYDGPIDGPISFPFTRMS